MTRSAIWPICIFLALVCCQTAGLCASAKNDAGPELDPGLGAPNKEALAKAYAHYTMGILYDNQDNLKLAAEEYQKALKYDEAVYIHMRLAFSYLRLGRYGDAIKQLNIVTMASGRDQAAPTPLTLGILADLYVSQGKLKEAIGVYKELIKEKILSLSPFVQFNIGILYSKLDNPKGARYSLKKAIMLYERQLKADPQMVKEIYLARFYLATICEKIEDRLEAKKQLRRAIYLYPDDPESLNYLGYMYAQDGEKLDYSVLLIKKALGFEPDNAAYLDSLGWAYFKKGMVKEALDNLEKANELTQDPVISEHLEEVRKKMTKTK